MENGSSLHAKLIVWIYIRFWIPLDQSAERFFKIAGVERMLHVFLRYSWFQRLRTLWANAQSRKGSRRREIVKLLLAESMDSWFFLSFSRCVDFLVSRSGRGEEPKRGNILHLIRDPLTDAEVGQNLANSSRQFGSHANAIE